MHCSYNDNVNNVNIEHTETTKIVPYCDIVDVTSTTVILNKKVLYDRHY